ncbi:Lrp/AsnC family transcriptional regulator [Mycobacterium sp.]|uniref:Lrp/AsnC family transcriptional regulator n=1 Tax=Mycobacterium sp. TaxID=1785 RepID=UPI003C75AB3C
MSAVGDGVDELDVALLDALHVNPQVSFEELGRVLDVSPVTAARRWRRLVSTGRAWVSSAIGPRLPVQAALFEAECEPGAAPSVANELAGRPQVFSVNITTGRDNIYALLVAADQPLLSALIVDVLPAVTGLLRVQSALITKLFSGTRWRLGGLSSGQLHAVTPDTTTNAQAHEFDEFDRALFLALQRDGRLSSRDLAAAVGQSEPAVRRRMDLLTRAGLLAFRTDFARVEAGWPSGVALKLRVTGAPVAVVGRTLVRYPETRFCAATVGAGAKSLFVTMQLHKLSALDGVVSRLLAEHPGVAVLDTRVVLRSVKSWGRLLGPDGHAQEIVPVDLWAPVNT